MDHASPDGSKVKGQVQGLLLGLGMSIEIVSFYCHLMSSAAS